MASFYMYMYRAQIKFIVLNKYSKRRVSRTRRKFATIFSVLPKTNNVIVVWMKLYVVVVRFIVRTLV